MTNTLPPNAAVSSRVRDLLATIEAKVHPKLVEHVSSMLDVGELRIAIEDLCDLLCEDEVVLAAPDHEELLNLAKSAGIDDRYWAALHPPA